MNLIWYDLAVHSFLSYWNYERILYMQVTTNKARFNKVTAALFILFISSCIQIPYALAERIMIRGSAGSSIVVNVGDYPMYIYGDEAGETPHGFTLEYSNWIRFNRNLTISVDSVFARLKSGDKNAEALINEFVHPAYEILDDYCTVPEFIEGPTPQYSNRKYIITSDYSEWVRILADDSEKILLAVKNVGKRGLYRCRLKITYAEVEFNSVTPRTVKIKAKLLVELQKIPDSIDMQKITDSAKLKDSPWINIEYDLDGIKTLGEEFRKDIDRRYYKYLSNERYEVTITPEFKGSNE